MIPDDKFLHIDVIHILTFSHILVDTTIIPFVSSHYYHYSNHESSNTLLESSPLRHNDKIPQQQSHKVDKVPDDITMHTDENIHSVEIDYIDCHRNEGSNWVERRGSRRGDRNIDIVLVRGREGKWIDRRDNANYLRDYHQSIQEKNVSAFEGSTETRSL